MHKPGQQRREGRHRSVWGGLGEGDTEVGLGEVTQKSGLGEENTEVDLGEGDTEACLGDTEVVQSTDSPHHLIVTKGGNSNRVTQGPEGSEG